MTAEFYLLARSFRYREGLSVEEIEIRIEGLFHDYGFIKRYDENIFRHDSIYEEEIYPNIKVFEFLYDPSKSSGFDRDIRQFLRKIIDHSRQTELSAKEVLILLGQHSENRIFGLICLHKIEGIDEKYLVYDRNDWFDFHRYFLGLYPVSESHFVSEAAKYFQDLFFHENVLESLKHLEGGLGSFSKTIVLCLSKLNDDLPEWRREQDGNMNLPAILQAFSSKTGIETTLEGDIDRKKDLTFEFDTGTNRDNDEKEDICCEPHMKMGTSDHPGDSKHYFNRIYFHIGKEHIQDGKILVCHIGRHL